MSEEEVKIELKTRTGTIYYWVCPKCGKVIEHLNPAYLAYLADQHLLKHKHKRKEGKA